jgi:outer membrane immunogenic protein
METADLGGVMAAITPPMRREVSHINKESLMRNRLFAAVGLLASAATCAGPAMAADILSVRQPPMQQPVPPSPPYTPDWTGFYVGVHGGGGWGHTSFDPSESVFRSLSGTPDPFFTAPNPSPKGGLVGGQVGYNWQWGQVVGGLETDFSAADINDSTAFQTPGTLFSNPATFSTDYKIDELASVRGRLGYLILPSLLAYGTGGAGWGHFRWSANSVDTAGNLASETTFSNEFGWVAGAGLEWKLSPNWLLRGEWLHYDFGQVTNPPIGALFPLNEGNVKVKVDVARAALSYKF